MKQLIITPESLISNEEVELIPSIMSKTEYLRNKIYDGIEVWVVGRNNEDFWADIITPKQKNNQVVDPIDMNPINVDRFILHVATMIDSESGEEKLVFGNTDDTLYIFVLAVLNRIHRLHSEYTK